MERLNIQRIKELTLGTLSFGLIFEKPARENLLVLSRSRRCLPRKVLSFEVVNGKVRLTCTSTLNGEQGCQM